MVVSGGLLWWKGFIVLACFNMLSQSDEVSSQHISHWLCPCCDYSCCDQHCCQYFDYFLAVYMKSFYLYVFLMFLMDTVAL